MNAVLFLEMTSPFWMNQKLVAITLQDMHLSRLLMARFSTSIGSKKKRAWYSEHSTFAFSVLKATYSRRQGRRSSGSKRVEAMETL